MPDAPVDHRRATAERNIEAILDAAEELIEQRADASIVAVAAAAGVSRVTVYAHFPTREALLEAVVERAVERSTAAMAEIEPDKGPPGDALRRLTAVGWEHVSRTPALAQAAARQLSPAAMKRAHESAYRPVHDLVLRGRDEGAFRTDVPAEWLVSMWFAVMHACGEEVRSGRIAPSAAPDALVATVESMFAPPAG